MKKILIIALLAYGLPGFCQVGISTTTPDAAAELDIVSPNNNTGVLIPIFTNATITSALNLNQPPHGTLIYNSSIEKFMFNAGDGTTPLWSVVGTIPVIKDYTSLAAVKIEGDIRYDATTHKIYFYNGTAWKELVP